MAENEGERSFWWGLIKACAAITLIDHLFPNQEQQYTEYEKLSIEKSQKIDDLKGVISKYKDKINNLKLELGEVIFKEKIKFDDELLNLSLKELNELQDEVTNKENQLKSIKIINGSKKEE